MSRSAVKKNIAISAGDEAARLGDQPKNLPPLTRGFPGRTDKSVVVGKDEAVGEVTRRRTRHERIVNSKEAAQPQPLIVRDDVSALGGGAGGTRYQMHMRDSCDAQFISLIARDRDGGNGQGGSVSNAKSQPDTAPTGNEMLSG